MRETICRSPLKCPWIAKRIEFVVVTLEIKGRNVARAIRLLAPSAIWLCGLLAPSLVLADVPSFVGKYSQPRSQKYIQVNDAFKQARVLEKLAEVLSTAIRFPDQVTLTIRECGQANAFYNRQKRLIVLCHELMENISVGIKRDFARISLPGEVDRSVAGAVMFILMHELGHAFVAQFDLPILGREEDAADQIGAFFILNTQHASDAIAGALWFFKSKTLFYTRQHFSDEHSLGPQRQSNLACWAIGKDHARYSYLMHGGFVTKQRAPRCRNEYLQLESSIYRLLGTKVDLPKR